MLHYFKKVSLSLTSLILLASTYAQQLPGTATTIAPMEISIASNETSVLIFPTAIKSVDRGSGEILTKVVKDVSNVLKLKAAVETLSPTNLHVFTADGKVFAFAVKYNPAPANLTIDLSHVHPTGSDISPVQFSAGRLNDAGIEQAAAAITTLKPLHNRPRSIKIGNTRLVLHGAYLKDGVLFFQLSLNNRARLPYHIDFVRAYIRDKKKTRRASVTEQEVQPLFSRLSEDTALPGHPAIIVLAFDQFTIADGKYLAIESFEKNGDRVLSCKLKGKHLLNVKQLE